MDRAEIIDDIRVYICDTSAYYKVSGAAVHTAVWEYLMNDPRYKSDREYNPPLETDMNIERGLFCRPSATLFSVTGANETGVIL